MISSLSKNTKDQYTCSLRQWWDYCYSNGIDAYNFNVNSLLKFLTHCLNLGASYGTLNNHRSAIALISSINISENNTLKRFFKGVFKIKPVFPRYSVTWDPNTVLNYLDDLSPNDTLSFEQLSKKLVVLLALATGQRLQTLSLIKVPNIHVFEDKIVIKITDLIKTSGIGRAQPVLNLPFFRQRITVCPAATLQAYLTASSCLRPSSEERLLLTHKKPHRAATTQTIGRWIKDILNASGIDTSIFHSHSTRHASTSAALRAGVNFDIIRKSAGWSERSATFANFYNLPIVQFDGSLINHLD